MSAAPITTARSPSDNSTDAYRHHTNLTPQRPS